MHLPKFLYPSVRKMMIDWGLPLGLQEDCLDIHGLYVDETKIAGGIPRVMPEDALRKKIAAYASHKILYIALDFSFYFFLFTAGITADPN